MKLHTAFFALFCPVILLAQSQKLTFTQPKMGSPFTVLVYAEPADSMRLVAAVDKAFKRVDTLTSSYKSSVLLVAVSRLPTLYQHCL